MNTIFDNLNLLINHEGFKRYFKNSSWLLLEKGIRILLGISIGTWVARYLGPKDFGSLSYANSFVSIFLILAMFGVDGILTRELVRHKDNTSLLLGTSFCLKILGSSLAFILVLATDYIVKNDKSTSLLIYVIAISILFKTSTVILSYFQSRVLSKYFTLSNLFSLILCSLLRVFLILNNYPLFYFALTISIDIALASLIYIYFYTQIEGGILSWKFDMRLAKKILKESWPYLFSGVMLTIHTQIDRVMLKNILDSSSVGFYSAAAKITESIIIIPILIINSLFPALINSKKTSHKSYIFRIQKLHDLTLLISLSVLLPIFLFSALIIDLLYGKEFNIAGSILKVHIFCGFFIAIRAACSSWILAENLQRYEITIHLIGAFSNIVFNFIFIKLWGVIGAAWGTITAYFFTFLFTAAIIPQIRPAFYMTIKSIGHIITFRFLKREYFKF